MARETADVNKRLAEELCDSLRRVLKWAEAYEPPRQHRREYDADLDKAEALLSRAKVDRLLTR